MPVLLDIRSSCRQIAANQKPANGKNNVIARENSPAPEDLCELGYLGAVKKKSDRIKLCRKRNTAGRKIYISNEFIADLLQIIDFLDVNKREIKAILDSE